MLLKIDQPLLCSLAVVLAVWMLVGRNIYSMIEGVMKVLLAIMTLAFIALAVMSGPDVVGIVKGTIGFSIPPDEGVHGALLAVIGAVAGSIANFVHPYVMRQKGWVGPQHKRVQRNDLLFAVFVGIVINLAIWIVGAEILRPNGIEVKTLGDLGRLPEALRRLPGRDLRGHRLQQVGDYHLSRDPARSVPRGAGHRRPRQAQCPRRGGGR